MIKTKRNKPCHCGSGIKYKKCCMTEDKMPKPKSKPRETTYKERLELAQAMAMLGILSEPRRRYE